MIQSYVNLPYRSLYKAKPRYFYTNNIFYLRKHVYSVIKQCNMRFIAIKSFMLLLLAYGISNPLIAYMV